MGRNSVIAHKLYNIITNPCGKKVYGQNKNNTSGAKYSSSTAEPRKEFVFRCWPKPNTSKNEYLIWILTE